MWERRSTAVLPAEESINSDISSKMASRAAVSISSRLAKWT